jgi:hypothetical protein
MLTRIEGDKQQERYKQTRKIHIISYKTKHKNKTWEDKAHNQHKHQQ